MSDLPDRPHFYSTVDVSPDGATLALGLVSPQLRTGIWSYDRERQTLSPIVVGEFVQSPLWTPDGRQIVYSATTEDTLGLYRRNADGTGEGELLLADPNANRLFAIAWTRTRTPEDDGDTLVAMKSDVQRNFHLLLISTSDRSVTELPLDSAGLDGSISPDGEWVAYSSNRSGRREVYVERFPELTERRLVSAGGGQQPVK